MKKKLISVLAAISLSAMLTACGDKDITGNYVNIANNDDVLIVTKSQNSELYMFKGKSKSTAKLLNGSLLPFNLAVQKKGDDLFLSSKNKKIGNFHNDQITLKFEDINIDGTYKKK